MSTTSETYNCAHNILELADILPYVYFATNMKWQLTVINQRCVIDSSLQNNFH